VVATPIGNLEDMTFRAVRILREIDRIACEDTRVTRRLCDHFGIDTQLMRHESHNEAASTEGILALLERGESVALVSDAGTPCINDPGQRLITAAIIHGYPVIPIPGASSLIVALSASGLPTENFTFHGFFPKKVRARRALISTLPSGTHAFFCPARDLPQIVDEVEETQPKTELVVAREITKRHEAWLRGSASDIAELLDPDAPPKGEAVVLLYRAPRGEDSISDTDIVTALMRHIDGGVRKKEAAARVSEALGISKRRVYQLTLQL
jgi:16S rRNA (cytidine1402-2'-O)-methyltransferase